MESFADWAASIRYIAKQEARVIEQLAPYAKPGGIFNLEDKRRTIAMAADAASFLEDLWPQERLVRGIAKVGALVDYPAYTPNIRILRDGDIVLLRAKVNEVHPDECEVNLLFEADRLSNRLWVSRRDVVGIEKR